MLYRVSMEIKILYPTVNNSKRLQEVLEIDQIH